MNNEAMNSIINNTDEMEQMNNIELLDESALSKLSKEEIIKYTLNLSTIFSQVAKLISELETKVISQTSELAVVKNANTLLQQRADDMDKRFTAIERDATNTSQYLRNQQIELKQLPEKIVKLNSTQLKETVAKILSTTGVNVTSTDIDKCHPLGQNNNAVILEFYCREQRDIILRSRKTLKNKKKTLEKIGCPNVMILESLCKSYGEMAYACRKLKSLGHILETWFFNGRLWIIPLEEAETKFQITHMSDLYDRFGQVVIRDIFCHDNN